MFTQFNNLYLNKNPKIIIKINSRRKVDEKLSDIIRY